MAARGAQRGRMFSAGAVVVLALAACGGSGGDDATATGDTVADTAAPATDAPATDPPATDAPSSDPPATDPPATDAPATDPPTTDPPGSTSPPTTQPPDPLDFGDELLDDAIAAGEAAPLTALSGRDPVATARLTGDLVARGFDLTGMDVTVYEGGAAPAFVILRTDDSTALTTSEDDEAAETFITDLIDHPAIDDAGVEQLVLQHSGSDDEGPFVVSFMVPIASLRDAVTTGADVFDSIAVQVERPG